MTLKNLFPAFSLLCICFMVNFQTAHAQTKMDSLSHYSWTLGLSSLWGYTDPQGREYALVGVLDGISVVDITEPTAPQELFFIPQPTGFWHEIKNWQQYAYATNETDGGIFIMDMGHLPDTVYYTNFTVDSLIKTSHALWIDEFGYAYISGYNNFTGSIPVNNRGVAILDLNQDPMNPTLVNTFTDQYVHDMYVRDNIMYACEIYNGRFTVIDVSDKSNLVVLASQNTPSLFTHNAWLSDNSQYLFTTDEKNNAYVAAYDISDLTDIKEVDRYQSNPGSLSMPHNVHVLNDFLVISYYRDGVKIVDAHEPDILVETEYFDTSPASGPGSSGCWGVYQLFPSGNVIASDRQLGMFVMRPEYKRACYLRGTVVDIQTGLPILGASLQLLGTNVSTNSDFAGQFKAGVAESGNYSLQFSRYGYETLTLTDITFTEAETVFLTVEMTPLDPFTLVVKVTDETSGVNLTNAFVEVWHSQGNYTDLTDAGGLATFNGLFNDTFNIYAASWGNLPAYQPDWAFDNANTNANVLLESGYYDDFYTDLGWTVNSVGANVEGEWVRAVPIASFVGDNLSNPDTDVAGDTGGFCFFTGNGFGLNPEDNALRTGNTTLYSPPINLSNYTNPYISFYRWFSAFNSQNNADSLSFYLSNGTETVLLQTITPDDLFQRQWQLETFRVNDFIALTSSMQFMVTAMAGTDGVILETGIDLFQITEDYAPQVGIQPTEPANTTVILSPNPASINAILTSTEPIQSLSVYDLQGRLIKTMQAGKGSVTTQLTLKTDDLVPGLYIVQVKTALQTQSVKLEVVR